jgi:DNA-binding Xre family transcriptional regulator
MDNYRMMTEIWNDFSDYFPLISKDAVDFYRTGRFEITVIFNDRRKAYYNYMNKTIHFIKPKDEQYTEDFWKKQFAISLSRKLTDKCMTQKDLSERSGISQMSLSKYINGKSVPSSYAVTRLADALECSVSELIDFDI